MKEGGIVDWESRRWGKGPRGGWVRLRYIRNGIAELGEEVRGLQRVLFG